MLLVAVVFSLVVVALARLVTVNLEFAQVAENRAERQAAALGAITHGVERVRLGQTLCGVDSAELGPVIDTVVDRNGASTELSCSRVSSAAIDDTGWAAVITGEGGWPEQLKLSGSTGHLRGQLYVQDIGEIDVNSALVHLDGDLWYHQPSCTSGATQPGGYTFDPPEVRGWLCTPQEWDDIVSSPTVPPNLASLPAKSNTDFVPYGPLDDPCRVYSPGRYTGTMALTEDPVYFQSGEYLFEDVRLSAGGQPVWFGHPGAATPALPNPACEGARDADPNVGGIGAVAYLSGSSRIRSENGGTLEMFPRWVGDRQLSIQALENGSGYPPSNRTSSVGSAILRLRNNTGPPSELVVHGLVYAPQGWIDLEEASSSATPLRGSAVVARLTSQVSDIATGATTPVLVTIKLTATATDSDGISTTVSAIVDYRPDEVDADDRVAIGSLRVVG